GGTALYARIMDVLAEAGKPWQKNTVITLLSRLMEKGLLKTNKIGRRNEYTAVVSAGDYQATQAKALLDKLYEGDAKGLVSTLIQRELLSRQDVEELRAMWESGVAHE
ncbi:MAG: BlaI/MecI/CopY family transcriptional regulator, partial [Oscillospiraceae bacterium]